MTFKGDGCLSVIVFFLCTLSLFIEVVKNKHIDEDILSTLMKNDAFKVSGITLSTSQKL